MLPAAVKGEKSIDVVKSVISNLSSGNIKPLSRVVIYRKYKDSNENIVEVPTKVNNVLDYDLSEDRQFGASSLSLTASNYDGLYSYGNINSPHNKIQDISDVQSVVNLDLSEGTFENTFYATNLNIEGYNSFGKWTSKVISSEQDFHSWHSLDWVILPSLFVKDSAVYHSSVDIMVRYGDAANTESNTWTPWQKLKTITGSLSSDMENFHLFSNQRFIQLQIRLYAAYDYFGPPSVQSITLKQNVKGSGYTEISNEPLYYYGNRITIEEGVLMKNNEIEWFNRFSGFLDKVSPSHTSQGMSLECTALDNMKMCLNDIIEKPHPNKEDDSIFEPNRQKEYSKFLIFKIPKYLTLKKVEIGGIDFNEDGNIDIPVEEEDYGFVYSIPYDPYEFKMNGPIRGYEYTSGPKSDERGDHKYIPWVQRPDIKVLVNGEHKRDGFDIDYEKGVVYFTEKPEGKDGQEPKVAIAFEWYDMDTNLLEDVLGEIIALAIERAGYDKPTRTRYKNGGYDIWQSEKHDFKIILEHSKPRVTVPPTGFYLDDGKTFFDALIDILKNVQADYTLRATPEGYFVGEHLPQLSPYVPEENDLIYNLNLVSSMDTPVSEESIFTRCIARGTLQSTRNVINKNTKIDDLATNSSDVVRFSDANERRTNLNRLKDGDLSTNAGWMFLDKEPALPKEMVKISLEKPIQLGGINILVGDGAGQPPDGSGNKWGEVNLNGFGMAIEVSPNNSDWYTLTEHDFNGSSGEWIRIGKSDFLPDIKVLKVKYLKIIATSAPNFDRGAKGFLWIFGRRHQNGKVWALRQVQVFPDEEIRVDVEVEDLIESLSMNQSPEVAEKIEQSLLSIKSRVGTKTEILPVNNSLQTEEKVKARGLDYLYETVRNLYTSNVEVVYAPYIRMGHTVRLDNPYLLDSDVYHNLYYVDGVSVSMRGGFPSTRLKLVNWI